jgi:hypothetical protein
VLVEVLVEDFIAYLREKRRFAAPTIANYRCSVNYLLGYLRVKNLASDAAQLPETVLGDCLYWLGASGQFDLAFIQRRRKAFQALSNLPPLGSAAGVPQNRLTSTSKFNKVLRWRSLPSCWNDSVATSRMNGPALGLR